MPALFALRAFQPSSLAVGDIDIGLVRVDHKKDLMEKLRIFTEETKTSKSLLLTLITSFGLKQNKHSDIVQKQITMDDLFI